MEWLQVISCFLPLQAFSVVEQLRGHSAARLAELEESVGSHQQLREALRHSCPLQVSRECCTSAAPVTVALCWG